MAVRTARTAWNGTLMEGTGQVELTSSGTGTFDVSFPRRTADEAEGITSPEELIGAAHSSCYAMQLSGVTSALTSRATGVPPASPITPESCIA